MDEAGPIIIFDTDCVLCSGMVAFILAHERDRTLRFAGAWSDEGSALAQRHGFSQADLDGTFLVVTATGALTDPTPASRSWGTSRHRGAGSSCWASCPSGGETAYTAWWRGDAIAGSAGVKTARSSQQVSGTG